MSFHPWEALTGAVVIPALVLAIPIHFAALGLVLTVMTVMGVTNHMGWEAFPKGIVNGPLGEWLITASHHQRHHAEYRGNYGLYFRHWDRLCGTDDPRGLTLTGGLPYFGGPGNNYSLHAIVETIARCRAAPGSFGLVFANGGFLTKHSFGVYSTLAGQIGPHDPYPQAAVDALASPDFTETPMGSGTVETFTVVFDKGAPAFAIVIGRHGEGRRFLGVGREELGRYMTGTIIGAPLTVEAGTPVNVVRLS